MQDYGRPVRIDDPLSEEEGITQQQLARKADSDPNTVRAMLVLLEKRGMVLRDPHPTDGRRKVALTLKGRQVLNRSVNLTQAVRERLYQLFTPEETANLAGYLLGISEAMERLNPKCKKSRSKTMIGPGRQS